MKLYFSPLSCSLATRIALYEAGAEATYVEVDPKTKVTSEGDDYRTIHALGLVPALALEDGTLLSENAAVLQLVAERFPDAALAPDGTLARAQLRQWLCYIGTELHKGLFVPLLDQAAPDAMKRYVLEKAEARLAWVARHLEARDFLLDRFGVADAYLFAVLNWAQVTPVDLTRHAPLTRFMARMHARPAVARAFEQEKALYLRERAKNAAA